MSAPAKRFKSARKLRGYCGKSATPSYWNAMSKVRIPVSVGVGPLAMRSRTGTENGASRCNSPPFGRFGFAVRTRVILLFSASDNPARPRFSRVSMLELCESPNMTIGLGSDTSASLTTRLRTCVPWVMDSLIFRSRGPVNGQNSCGVTTEVTAHGPDAHAAVAPT